MHIRLKENPSVLRSTARESTTDFLPMMAFRLMPEYSHDVCEPPLMRPICPSGTRYQGCFAEGGALVSSVRHFRR